MMSPVGRSERSDLRHVLIVAKMSGFVPQPINQRYECYIAFPGCQLKKTSEAL